ncbi:MAG: NifU family protein [Sphaerochaetaceae bacterium]|jgi:Fe-S cluster biogenesis protein NfuA|nr:NifU family protein [Sphaerochaetaceae bacterium]
MEKKVIDAINAIRPSLQNDGGDIEYLGMEGNTVKVKMHGSCAHCPYQEMTLKDGIQNYLRSYIDEKIEVVAVD